LITFGATVFAPLTFAQFADDKFIKPPPREESPLDALTGHTPPPEYGPGSAKPAACACTRGKPSGCASNCAWARCPSRATRTHRSWKHRRIFLPIVYELETPATQEQVDPGDTVVSSLDLLHRFNFVKVVIDF
jgi:hypothetical protein